MGIGPLLFYQQTQLTDIKASMESQEALELEKNTLSASNENLQTEVQHLNNTVTRLENVEDALAAINEVEGQNLETFQEQMQQNKEILDQLNQNKKAIILQNIFTIVMRSD